MDAWFEADIRTIAVTTIGQRYGRYRLTARDGEEEMVRSLQRYGQLAPIVVCVREEGPEVLDGFKRVRAAGPSGMRQLAVRYLDVDERGAKAAIYGLNCIGRHLAELEEAWIVRALVREDGLSQVEVARLLTRHKSWVCRRLALLERLSHEAREDLGLGLLGVSVARQLLRLPAGNQEEVLRSLRQHSLNGSELRGIIDLLLAASNRPKEEYILSHPREALAQARGVPVPGWDPRLSPAGNRTSRQLASLLDSMSRMITWLDQRGRADLSACDRPLLGPPFVRLVSEARRLTELAEDFVDHMAEKSPGVSNSAKKWNGTPIPASSVPVLATPFASGSEDARQAARHSPPQAPSERGQDDRSRR